jgi:nucleoside-diphosphate-sugar epimerase
VKKLIHTSSISVFEAYKHGASNANDSFPVAQAPFANHYAHSKVLAEKEVLSVNGKGGLVVGAIRPVGIFGPRELVFN